MTIPDDPLISARARLEGTLETLTGIDDISAMTVPVGNAIVALGGMARAGASTGDMARAVARTGEAVRRYFEMDLGDAATVSLLDSRATALAGVVRQYGDLAHLGPQDRQNWFEEAYQTLAERDAADAWLLGAAALLRWFQEGIQHDYLEAARERTVAAIVRFDRAIDPALAGLSPLRETANMALERARSDRGYTRRVPCWTRILAGG